MRKDRELHLQSAVLQILGDAPAAGAGGLLHEVVVKVGGAVEALAVGRGTCFGKVLLRFRRALVRDAHRYLEVAGGRVRPARGQHRPAEHSIVQAQHASGLRLGLKGALWSCLLAIEIDRIHLL